LGMELTPPGINLFLLGAFPLYVELKM